MYTDGLLHEHSRLEDEYFYKKDRELIEKIKERERQKKDLLARTEHYHKCAKCGQQMEDRVWDDIRFLACNHCASVHMSLETLERIRDQHQKTKTFVGELKDSLKIVKESA